MASRRLVAAAAAAATSPSPLARLVSRPGLAGPAGRYWPEKLNLWEDPMNLMRSKASLGFRRFSTEVREPAHRAVSGIESIKVKKPAGKALSGMLMWWHRATYPIHRIKNHMGMQERAMARFVLLVFGAGTPTVVCVKKVWDLCY